MEADLSRLPTGTSGWLALVDYATSMGDLTEVYWFELKGRLSFADKSKRKRSAATVSRAILGLSNRMPEMAQKHVNGYGIVMVGIEGTAVVGVEEVDGAVLWDAVQPFVGDDGPRWDFQFINHPDGLVLALVVDPPKWGDRIYSCRREFQDSEGKLSLRDGDIFVRVPGKTRPATSQDLVQLDLRRSRAPHSGAKVQVEYDATFDHVDSKPLREQIERYADNRADALLSEIPRQSASSYPFGAGFSIPLSSGNVDTRSSEQFRAEVEEWREESKGLADEVVAEYFRWRLTRGRLLIRNESVRYLEGVQVQVTFPPGVLVLMGSDGTYYDDGGRFRLASVLPDPPPKFGTFPYDLFSPAIPYSPSFDTVASLFEVEVTPEGTLVTWNLGDLPSTKSEKGKEQFAICTEEPRTELVATWTVTARGIDHVFQGELRLKCEQDPGSVL